MFYEDTYAFEGGTEYCLMGRWTGDLKGNEWEWFVHNRILGSKIKWFLCEFLNLPSGAKTEADDTCETFLPVGSWRPVEDNNKLFCCWASVKSQEFLNLPQVWKKLIRDVTGKVMAKSPILIHSVKLLHFYYKREIQGKQVIWQWHQLGLWSSVLSFQFTRREESLFQKRLAGLPSLPNIKMSLIFQTSPCILYIVLYLHPVDLWKQKTRKVTLLGGGWISLLITLKDKTGNVILKCSTQNEVMVSKNPVKPQSEIVCQQSKQRAGTIPASGSRVQLTVSESQFCCAYSRAS